MDSPRSHFQDYLFREHFLNNCCLPAMLGRKVAGLRHDVAEAMMAWTNSLTMFLLVFGSSVQPLDGAHSYIQTTACMA